MDGAHGDASSASGAWSDEGQPASDAGHGSVEATRQGREILPTGPGLLSRDSTGACGPTLQLWQTAGDRRWTEDSVGWFLAGLSLALLVERAFLAVAGGVLRRPGVVGVRARRLDRPVIVRLRAVRGRCWSTCDPATRSAGCCWSPGCSRSTNVAADAYATRALTDPDGSLPAGLVARLGRVLDLAAVAAAADAGAARALPDRPAAVAYWLWHVRARADWDRPGRAGRWRTGPGRRGRQRARARGCRGTAPVWAAYASGVPAVVAADRRRG